MNFCKSLGIGLVPLFFFLIVAGCSEKEANSNEQSGAQQEEEPARVCKTGSRVIEDLWLTPAPLGGTSGAYGRIRLDSQESDSLVEITCNVAGRVELHDMRSDSGEMAMVKLATPLHLSQEEPLILKPGGKHIMFINLQKEIEVGDSIEIGFRWIGGVETTCIGVVSVNPPERPKKKVESNVGKNIYSRYCAACHGETGEGQGNIFPPLANSDFLRDKEKTISAIVNGLQGEIIVNGKKYNGMMNRLPAIYDNQEAAEVINFTLQKFADSSWQTTAEEVAKIRD